MDPFHLNYIIHTILDYPLGIAQLLWILAGHAPVVSLYARLVMP